MAMFKHFNGDCGQWWTLWHRPKLFNGVNSHRHIQWWLEKHIVRYGSICGGNIQRYIAVGTVKWSGDDRLLLQKLRWYSVDDKGQNMSVVVAVVKTEGDASVSGSRFDDKLTLAYFFVNKNVTGMRKNSWNQTLQWWKLASFSISDPDGACKMWQLSIFITFVVSCQWLQDERKLANLYCNKWSILTSSCFHVTHTFVGGWIWWDL